ncbi:MAG TPA: hypothetical protein VKC90_09125 [Chitinophagaceae bacterium]|nr:hypothetical protein [Chitinophagaceae bacterium]
MEQDQPSSLFEMDMDNTAQANLLSISKWTRFISITGFVVGALLLLLMTVASSQVIGQISALTAFGEGNFAGAIIAVVIIVFAFAGTWLYFLFKASSLIKRGLQNRNTDTLAQGFKAMRIYFVFSMIFSVLSILGTLTSMLN